MASKVPHKAKSASAAVSTRSTSEKIMIVLSILIALSMILSLFAGLF